MPTERKNKPSRMPRNGSMSASSWWRNVDSDSSTPAMKAPIAIDRPPHCMNSAAPSTTSSAAAVMTSRPPSAATMRNNGLMAQRPAASRPPSAPSAISTDSQAGRDECDAGCRCASARNATSASNGMIERSSSSRIDTARWPAGDAVTPRSSSIFMITAVDDSTKPIAPITATAGGQPKARPTPDSSAPQTSTCASPSPKISLRNAHSLVGRISSPIRNRNSTTPSSATCRMACGSSKNPSPKGPISRPAQR